MIIPGVNCDLTPAEIEAVYRFREREYRMEDARRHLYHVIGTEDAEDLNDEELSNNLYVFCNTYDIDSDIFINDDSLKSLVESIVEEFDKVFDCNIPENELWEIAIRNVMDSLKNETDKIRTKCYELYRLDWMAQHGVGISDLLDGLETLQNAYLRKSADYSHFGSDLGPTISEVYNEWADDYGFDGSLWACYDEFIGAEYLDAGYMHSLLEKAHISADQYDADQIVKEVANA